MIDALLVSQVVLWVLVVLGALVLVLARQVGILHERIAPAGALALSNGPRVGVEAPQVAALSLSGAMTRVGEARADGRAQLLVFVSPRCPVCKTLLPTAKQIARAQRVQLVFASDGAEEDHARFARDYELDTADYFVSTDLGLRYQIAKLPYAVLIDSKGVVRAQGIVNTREHLESLFEAQARGVASIQEYLGAGAGAGARASVDANPDADANRDWQREAQA